MLYIQDIRTLKNLNLLSLNRKQVKVYCCGPTLYRRAHIGNFRSVLFISFLQKLLLYKGFELDAISNITDVGHEDENNEDKVLQKAQKEKLQYYNLVQKYANMYFSDIIALGLSSPAYMPVSSFLNSQYQFVHSIKPEYVETDSLGIKISQSFIDSIKSNLIYGGSRLQSFYVWKYKDIQLLDFEHKGLPGWHTGCFALVDYLFRKDEEYTIDVHVGGKDLADIHFNAELVQHYVKYNNFNFARCWTYIGNVTYNGKKISKSKDNCVYVSDLLKRCNASVIKMILCAATNDEDVDINEEQILHFTSVYYSIVSKICTFLIKQHVNNIYADEYIMRAFMSVSPEILSMTTDMNHMLRLLTSTSISSIEDLQTVILLDDLLCLNIIKTLLLNFKNSMKYWYLGAKHVHIRNKQLYDVADEIRIQLIENNLIMLTYENVFLLYEKV